MRSPVGSTRRSARLVVLLCSLAGASGFRALPRAAAPRLRSGGADIPDVVIGKARLALATKRTVGDEDEMRILWQTFKKCYPNEKLAIEAAEKNSNVFNPQLNSPTKIMGTFALLTERFGKKGAQELILRNPGILICTPRSLSKESNESILKAADLIEVLDANKPLIRVIARTNGVVLLTLIIYGIIKKNAGPDVDVLQLIFDRYFGAYSH